MDLTDQEQERRRERLRAWVADRGGHAKVVDARRLNGSQASYLSQVVHGYSFGSRAARAMEERLGMPQHFLDAAVPNSPAGTGRALSAQELPRLPYGTAEVLEAMATILAGVAPELRDAVARNLDGWARAGGAEPYRQVVLMLLTGGTEPGARAQRTQGTPANE